MPRTRSGTGRRRPCAGSPTNGFGWWTCCASRGTPLPRSNRPWGSTGWDDLLASFARSGLRVTRRCDGVPRTLPRATDLTAYRVVQESLTNVCKHAGEVEARLTVRYEPESLTVMVENDGAPAAAADTSGATHGLAGMRERVLAIGGTLLAGPRPGGGFRVSAVLPTGTAGRA